MTESATRRGVFTYLNETVQQMKTFLLLGLIAATVVGCSSGGDNNSPSGVTAGSWRVSTFSERGEDETGDFAGYVFTFSGDGKALARKNGTERQGTWSTNNNSRFNIDFGAKTDANKPLGELTDDWKIISISASQIRLTDDNPSSAEFLTFTKN